MNFHSFLLELIWLFYIYGTLFFREMRWVFVQNLQSKFTKKVTRELQVNSNIHPINIPGEYQQREKLEGLSKIAQ